MALWEAGAGRQGAGCHAEQGLPETQSASAIPGQGCTNERTVARKAKDRNAQDTNLRHSD